MYVFHSFGMSTVIINNFGRNHHKVHELKITAFLLTIIAITQYYIVKSLIIIRFLTYVLTAYHCQ